jgi:hypothetical protein
MQFIPNSLLQEAVENHHLRHIRSAISSYMVSDPSDSRGEIMPAIHYVEQSGITDLWQAHDQQEFKARQEWDEEYYGLIQAEFMFNYSKDRFEHALEVGRKVYGKPVQRPQNPSVEKNPSFEHSTVRPVHIQTNINSTTEMGKLIPIFIGLGVVAAVVIVTYLIKRD